MKKANEELERRRTAELENSRAELEAQNENLVKYWMTWERRPLLNILINARDAFLERRTENALIKVRSFPEKDRAVVTIADNTGGIGEEIIDKIFDVYFTTKELGKGSGCSWRK